MKHKIADDVNVKVDVDIPVGEVSELVDKIGDVAIKIIVAHTIGHIVRQAFVK